MKTAAATIAHVRVFHCAPKVPATIALSIETQVRSHAELAAEHQGAVGAFLMGVATSLVTAPKIVSYGAAGEDALKRLEELLVERANAESVAIAATGADPQTTVETTLPELWESFLFARQITEVLLAPYGLTLPHSDFATAFAPTIAASCQHLEEDQNHRDEINLDLPEKGFTVDDLHSVPYLLAHECICHAAQGIASTDPRDASGPACPWSDGWMDCLAHTETEAALFAGAGDNTWMEPVLPVLTRCGATAHMRRYDTIWSSMADKATLRTRQQAMEAWDGLLLAAIENGIEEEAAQEIRRAFSVRFNAIAATPTERSKLVTGLWVKLMTKQGPSALAAVTEFLRSGDYAALIRAVDL